MEKILGVAAHGRPKTKIVCTLGPSSRSVDMLEKLLRAGMNVARFNFSHGTHVYHQHTLDNLRIAMHNTGIPCAIMLDTKVHTWLSLYILLICSTMFVFEFFMAKSGWVLFIEAYTLLSSLVCVLCVFVSLFRSSPILN